MWSDNLNQTTTVCIQHTTTHLVIVHPMFSSHSGNPSEISIVEQRKWLGKLNEDYVGYLSPIWSKQTVLLFWETAESSTNMWCLSYTQINL